jgi:hypothetical protein
MKILPLGRLHGAQNLVSEPMSCVCVCRRLSKQRDLPTTCCPLWPSTAPRGLTSIWLVRDDHYPLTVRSICHSLPLESNVLPTSCRRVKVPFKMGKLGQIYFPPRRRKCVYDTKPRLWQRNSAGVDTPGRGSRSKCVVSVKTLHRHICP